MGEAAALDFLDRSFGRAAWIGRTDPALAPLFGWNELNRVLADHQLDASRLRLERGGVGDIGVARPRRSPETGAVSGRASRRRDPDSQRSAGDERAVAGAERRLRRRLHLPLPDQPLRRVRHDPGLRRALGRSRGVRRPDRRPQAVAALRDHARGAGHPRRSARTTSRRRSLSTNARWKPATCSTCRAATGTRPWGSASRAFTSPSALPGAPAPNSCTGSPITC